VTRIVAEVAVNILLCYLSRRSVHIEGNILCSSYAMPLESHPSLEGDLLYSLATRKRRDVIRESQR
jgi:hypothetical protein